MGGGDASLSKVGLFELLGLAWSIGGGLCVPSKVGISLELRALSSAGAWGTVWMAGLSTHGHPAVSSQRVALGKSFVMEQRKDGTRQDTPQGIWRRTAPGDVAVVPELGLPLKLWLKLCPRPLSSAGV